MFNSEKHYFVVYKAVSGLGKSSPVFLHGVKIGTVKTVSFIPDKPSYPIVVDLAISSKVIIPKNSVVWISSSDLLGSKALEIHLGNSSVMASEYDTLSGFIQTTLQEEITQQMGPIKNKAESLMESIDSAMMIIRLVFNEKTRYNLETSFVSIKNTTKNLENLTYDADQLVGDQKTRLANILGNVESISQNIKNNNTKITNILANFSDLSDTLAKINIVHTFHELNTSLDNTSEMFARVNKGEGSLGKLLTNDSLYNALNHSSEQLDLLLEDVRLNPTRYVHFSVFGKNNSKTEAKPASGK